MNERIERTMDSSYDTVSSPVCNVGSLGFVACAGSSCRHHERLEQELTQP
jgi:hypothetical protein